MMFFNTNSRIGSLIKNIGLVFAGTAGSKLILFFLLPFYTAYFTPEEYGGGDLVVIYGTMLLAILTGNIFDAVFLFPKGKAFAVQRRYFSSGLFFQLALLVVGGGVLTAIRFLMQDSSGFFIRNIWWIFFVAASQALQSYTQQFARGADKMAVYVSAGVVHSATLALFSLLLVPYYGITGFLTAQIAGPLAGTGFAFFAGKMYRYFSFRAYDKRFLVRMLQYSIPLAPTTFMWWLISSSNRPLLEIYTGLATVGLFAVAVKIPALLSVGYGIFNNAWTISVVEEYKKNDFSQYFNKMFLLIYFTLIFLASGMTVFMSKILALVVSKEFQTAWVYIPVMMFSAIFSSMAGFIGPVFAAHKKSVYFLYSCLICGVTCILLNFLLIPAMGLWGAVIAAVGSSLVMFIARLFYAWRYVQLKNILFLFYCTLSSLALAVFTIYFKHILWSFVLLILIFLPVFYLQKRNISEIYICLKEKVLVK